MVRFSCQASALLILASALPGAESFTNNGMRARSALRRRQTVQRLPAPPSVSADDGTILYALPTAEESAKALSDYMAKSHEDKLRAVKDAESKKNAEIQVRAYISAGGAFEHLLCWHRHINEIASFLQVPALSDGCVRNMSYVYYMLLSHTKS